MTKIKLTFLATVFTIGSFAQNNVGIGTTTPDASSVLEVSSTDKGLLVPRLALLATNNASPVTAPATSLLVYNTATAGTNPNDVTPGYYFWNGTIWVRLLNSPSSSACVTLDEAYDCTTPGAGRIVTVNNGSIEFNQTGGTNTEVLTVNSNQGTVGTPVNTIYATHSGIGNALIAEVSNATVNQDFAPIVGSVLNSTTNNTGVHGLYNGSGATASGGIFQVTTTDGGIGMISINASPSTAQTNFGGLSFSLGGSANNYGLQGVVGDGSGNVNTWTSTDITTAGVYGYNESTTGGAGVFGYGVQGVVGLTDYAAASAVYGRNFGGTGVGDVVGVLGDGGYGVWGQTTFDGGIGTYGLVNPAVQTVSGAGVLGEGAGLDWGVFALGDIGATGVKPFNIDHPEDPENKTLKHFSIESNEVLNVYRGTEQFDANGVATITLPSYFDDININFSYQLTAVGAPSAGMYVSKEIHGTEFEIAGGSPNQKVSWTVYAERNDKYLQENPDAKKAEIDKVGNQIGKYWDPRSYNQDRSKGIFPGGEIKTNEGGSDEHKNIKKAVKLPNKPTTDSSNSQSNQK